MDKYENEIRQNKKFNKSEVEVKRKSDETIMFSMLLMVRL